MNGKEVNSINYWLKLMIIMMATGVLANGTMIYSIKTDVAVLSNDMGYMKMDINDNKVDIASNTNNIYKLREQYHVSNSN